MSQTTANPTTEPSVTEQALALLDLGLKATTAYERPDLTTRLQSVRGTLASNTSNVVVIGEFKQGKSSLVNALLNAAVCAVDDDIATAIPASLQHTCDSCNTAPCKCVGRLDHVGPRLRPAWMTARSGVACLARLAASRSLRAWTARRIGTRALSL